jgi:hypothetical protein
MRRGGATRTDSRRGDRDAPRVPALSASARSALFPLGVFVAFLVSASTAHLGLSIGIDKASQRFVETRGFELWQLLIAAQLLTWIVALPRSILILRRHGSTVNSPWPVTLASGGLLFCLLVGPLLHLLLEHQMNLPLRAAWLRLTVLWGIGALIDAVLLASLMSTGLVARRAALGIEHGSITIADGVESLRARRAELQATLAWAGLILSLAVLGTAALNHLVEQLGDATSGSSWTRENVLGFGVYNTIILALAYLPASTSTQAIAAALLERLCSMSANEGDVCGLLKRRQDLGKILQLDVDPTKVLGRMVPILAPLLSGILNLAGLK